MTMVIFLAALVILFLISLLTIRLGLKRLTCDRSFSRPAAFPGEEGELVETVRNDSPWVIPWLRLECRIPPQLHLGKQDNLYVSAETYYSSLFTLMPHQQIRRTHKVQFLGRGAFDLGRVSMTAGDILGVTQLRRKQEEHAPVLVYPRLLDAQDIPLPLSLMLGELSNRRQLQEDPFLFRGIRPYLPGDPVRDIHWPATARAGEVQLRVRDYTARTRLLVVLNAQGEEEQWHDRNTAGEEAAIEYGISLAASLCVQAIRMGLSAGFAANMPQGRSKESTILLPMDGAAREEELLAAFARLDVVRTQSLPLLLEALTKYNDLDILILSRYDSDAVRESMEQLRRCGNQVTFHLLEGGAQ